MEKYIITYYNKEIQQNKTEIVEGFSWVNALKFLLESTGIIFREDITYMLYSNTTCTIKKFNDSTICPIKIIEISGPNTKVVF